MSALKRAQTNKKLNKTSKIFGKNAANAEPNNLTGHSKVLKILDCCGEILGEPVQVGSCSKDRHKKEKVTGLYARSQRMRKKTNLRLGKKN